MTDLEKKLKGLLADLFVESRDWGQVEYEAFINDTDAEGTGPDLDQYREKIIEIIG
jgi:hypothetical protein